MFEIGDSAYVVLGGHRLLAVIQDTSYSGTMHQVLLDDGKKVWVDRDALTPTDRYVSEDGWLTQYPGTICWPEPIPEGVLLRIQRNVLEEIARIRRRELWAKHKDDIVVLSEVQRPPYTMVTVMLGSHRGVGFAKCSPADKWNAQTGKDIAKGRAIADLLTRMVEDDA